MAAVPTLFSPHHENEKAQAEGAALQSSPARAFVRYWVHNNMFTFKGEKMAKSTGNQTLMRYFLEMYHGEIFKYLVLSSHYRSLIEVSEKKIIQCIQALERIYSFLKTAELLKSHAAAGAEDKVLKGLAGGIEKALEDDLNTPKALAVLFTGIRYFNDLQKKTKNPAILSASANTLKHIIQTYGRMMSLFQEPPAKFLRELDDIFLKKYQLKREDIEALVKERERARQSKDFKTADALREKLLKMRIAIKDSTQKTEWETIKTV